MQSNRHPGSRTRSCIEALEARRLLSVGIFSTSQDIGSPAIAGSASFAAGSYSIAGAGTDIGGLSDQFQYAYSALVPQSTLIARITTQTNTNGSAKAGLMFRNTTSANSAFVGIFVTPSNGLALVSRLTDGGTAGSTNVFLGGILPRYLRLSQSGSAVSAYHSTDAVNWIQVGTAQSPALASGALAGLAVTSRNVAALSTATFTSASVLPAGWSDTDIGAPAQLGSATFDASSNSFTVTGGGSGFGGTSDQLNLAHRSMTGDRSIVARIDSLTGGNSNAFAGVSIRDTLAAGAIFAAVGINGQGNVTFKWRSTTSGSAQSTTGPGVTAPVWVRLQQAGNTFRADYSSDKVAWTQLGSTQTIALSIASNPTGLAVTSANTGATASAVLSGVSIVPGSFTASSVGGAQSPGETIFDPSSNTYTVVGAGTGIEGTADQFEFVSRSMTGNGSILSYLNSFDTTDPAAQAGIMLRATDAPDSVFAAVVISPQSGVTFLSRTSTGAGLNVVSIPGITAPVGLRLVRSGNTFQPYYSTDGITWLAFASAPLIVMPATIRAGLVVSSNNSATPATSQFSATGIGAKPPPGSGIYSSADEAFLHDLSQRSVRFFYDETNPSTGLVPDGSLANGGSYGSSSSIASVGFGLTALTIGDQRGWLTHNDAYQRALTTVNFLYNSGAQHNGFFYHFLNPNTGARAGTSELSSIDTALLMAGVINVAQYWDGTPLETAAMTLFNRVNWPFMQKPNGQFYGAWSPESGFQVFTYADFSEAALLYLLGMGSSTFSTAQSSWLSWSRTPVINYSGFNFVSAGTRALFTVQYPQAWFDMRGLTDSSGLNFFNNATTATNAQRQMFINMAPTYPHFGPNMWGATAADGPNGYTVFGGPPAANIDGTIVPTAPGGSLAFTPRRSVDALVNMQSTYGSTVWKKYGFVDAFNPAINWTSSIVLGIDVGMMLIAAENSRSNFVWDMFMQNGVAKQAMSEAFPSLTPELLAGASRKPNPIDSDLPIDLGGELSVESRVGGPTQIVLTFGANVIKGTNFNITLSSGTVSSSTASGSTLTINLSGAADAQTLVVTVTDLRHFATSAAGNYTFQLGVLLADATQDGAVNLDDFNVLATNFGQSNRAFYQGDFNNDTLVNLDDFNLLATQFGKSLASPQTGGLAGGIFARRGRAILPARTEDVGVLRDEASEPLLR